jgi:hypothetical protein
VTDALEQTARRIAERGRPALLEFLRPAFRRAAADHADVVGLDADQLERMVQAAADRADGLVWRRALAGVAREELGISLGEAVGHQAVARAQAIVGAPAYIAPPDGAAGDRARPRPDEAAGDEGEPIEATNAGPSEPLAQAIRLPAVHLQGIADLRRDEGNLELRFSGAGLDILSTDNDDVLGRLSWTEIQGLDMPHHGGLRRHRRSPPQLVVRTDRGEASFAVPGLTEKELRTHLAPMLERAGG